MIVVSVAKDVAVCIKAGVLLYLFVGPCMARAGAPCWAREALAGIAGARPKRGR